MIVSDLPRHCVWFDRARLVPVDKGRMDLPAQMVPYAETVPAGPRLRAADLQIAGFACIGLYFFCTGS